MVAKSPLPDGGDLPPAVNGWVHDPDSTRNGHVWTSADVDRSVAVFSHFGTTVSVAVFDDRVDGFANRIEPARHDIRDEESQSETVAWGVERAVAWMERHAPTEWDHPAIEAAVFDPPAGFVLNRYYLEECEHIVYYRQNNAERAVGMAGGRVLNSAASLETRAYLVVRAWRGSGNTTVALAPWLRAHDEAMEEVVDPPAECGLVIAVKLAREYVRAETGRTRDVPATGQADLGAWSP